MATKRKRRKFRVQMRGAVNATKDQLTRGIREVNFIFHNAIVVGTPVDEGFARGSWQIGINEPDLSTGKDTSTDGGATASKALASLSNFKLGDEIHHSNNMPYIRALEYGDYPENPVKGTRLKGGGYEIRSVGGFSRQAPAGMVRINLPNLRHNITKVMSGKYRA